MRPKVQLQVWNIILRKQQLEDQWEFCIYICTHKSKIVIKRGGAWERSCQSVALMTV